MLASSCNDYIELIELIVINLWITKFTLSGTFSPWKITGISQCLFRMRGWDQACLHSRGVQQKYRGKCTGLHN